MIDFRIVDVLDALAANLASRIMVKQIRFFLQVEQPTLIPGNLYCLI